MPTGRRSPAPRLRLIGHDGAGDPTPGFTARELDWSILMARAQSGDRDAYRRLLDEIRAVRPVAPRDRQSPPDRSVAPPAASAVARNGALGGA